MRSASDLRLDTPTRPVIPLQVRPLDYWPDHSIRWALVEFPADAGSVGDYGLWIDPGGSAATETGLRVSERTGAVQVVTGRATFGFSVGGAFPFSSISVGGVQPIDVEQSGLRVQQNGETLDFRVADVRVHETGPLRAELEVRGAARDGGMTSPLEVFARVGIFADTATAELEITIRNRRRARHPSGQWVLGDAGSLYLRSAAVVLTVSGTVERVRCAPEPGNPLSEVELPFEIYQESSGGDHWDAPVHRNREGRVPLRFRGYRWRSGAVERVSNRATPIVAADLATGTVAVAVPQFWENFPRAIAVEGRTIEIGLFPRQSEDPHELQGGEQKTHLVVLAFGEDRVSDPPLAWCHDPLVLYPSPDWCCATGAVPLLIPAVQDPNGSYLTLVAAALDPSHGFFSKRETADEYGWRNHGDLHADHESAFQPADRPFVSHYNNQYDAIAGFAIHFLRTGDDRWRRLMRDLARHVQDIDIYHTREDKAAYNGGMFWHTLHYADAATSTHRTYPRGLAAGGGPSAEHNYNTGLMLHYFMTGDRASREAAIGLGRWVLDMDDGRQTIFRWLARGATGLASGTGSMAYHGPGRAPANSILACLVASRLCGDATYAAKADELIRRCIHPLDDVDGRNLHDAERRWYYTVFLQALGAYLHQKAEGRQFDEMFGYAQASLLRYARWMAQHEHPYLDRPDVLEFPTETWAAQDMRKAEVFLWAAQHATGAERERFLERARFFFEYSVGALGTMPTRHFTRPVVLMLSNGLRDGWFQRHGATLPPPVVVQPAIASGPARPFNPQKARAIRRARWLAGLALVASIAVLTLLVT